MRGVSRIGKLYVGHDGRFGVSTVLDHPLEHASVLQCYRTIVIIGDSTDAASGPKRDRSSISIGRPCVLHPPSTLRVVHAMHSF